MAKQTTTQEQADENLKVFANQVDKVLELSGNLPLRDMFRQFVKEFKSISRVLRQWDMKAVSTSRVMEKKEQSIDEIKKPNILTIN